MRLQDLTCAKGGRGTVSLRECVHETKQLFLLHGQGFTLVRQQ